MKTTKRVEWPINLLKIILRESAPRVKELLEACPEMEASFMYFVYRLDQQSRDVILLHYKEHFTYAQIQEQLKISHYAVQRDLRFAKAWLCSSECRNFIVNGLSSYFSGEVDIELKNAMHQIRHLELDVERFKSLYLNAEEQLEERGQRDIQLLQELRLSVTASSVLRSRGLGSLFSLLQLREDEFRNNYAILGILADEVVDALTSHGYSFRKAVAVSN